MGVAGMERTGSFSDFEEIFNFIPAKALDKRCRTFGGCRIMSAVEQLAVDFVSTVSEFPIPSSLIKLFDQTRDIEVRLLPLKTLHGAVWLTDDAWVIHLNSCEGRPERRFTLFHEAFHILCRNSSPAFRRTSLARAPFLEAMADHFACCVLMPRELIIREWQNTGDVCRMAVLFDVPLTAMRRRLRQLNTGQ